MQDQEAKKEFLFIISHPSTHKECDDIMKLNGLVVSTIYQYHVQSLLASLKILKCYPYEKIDAYLAEKNCI